MDNTKLKELKRGYRHARTRKKVVGTTEQPRLCVHRSLKNLFAQVVDDSTGKVLFGMSTMNKEVRSKIKNGGNIDAASVLGESFAVEAKKKGIKKVCFDRGGYLYHGRVKAFAESVRKGGMEF
ncbi:MAG: 50S ribosomal protein L18 [Candidatus Omnitrophica bacterium]|nr:50S ribosomal protein L18 [Candidatus Omnitrophota bacterium]MBU1995956.1 50S ribosomal protein L18 [Candidatus Omnitrophota bacterium]MBU4333514.1 50S ribosomal protein L18 [Candidatus Omnitrophota bacterium]